MSEKRQSTMERVLQRIERHVQEWRDQEMTRAAEVEAHRAELWEEARERQRLLAEALAGEESRQPTLEEITKQHRIAFVLHREDLTGTLENIASTGDRLVNVVPGRGEFGGGKGIQGIKGSWLVFESDDPATADAANSSRSGNASETGRA